ncbi:MAG TPA: PilZ domain-containing protein [Vicinamibacterales bacterium]
MARMWFRALRLGKQSRREGRQAQRLARYFDCTWVSPWGEERARVSSLSLTGCYIESRFSVPADGVVIRELTIALPTGTVNLEGTVVDAMSGVGFAVRFSDFDSKTRESLNVVIDGAGR